MISNHLGKTFKGKMIKDKIILKPSIFKTVFRQNVF
jgi:hypothetical protein